MSNASRLSSASLLIVQKTSRTANQRIWRGDTRYSETERIRRLISRVELARTLPELRGNSQHSACRRRLSLRPRGDRDVRGHRDYSHKTRYNRSRLVRRIHQGDCGMHIPLRRTHRLRHTPRTLDLVRSVLPRPVLIGTPLQYLEHRCLCPRSTGHAGIDRATRVDIVGPHLCGLRSENERRIDRHRLRRQSRLCRVDRH